MILNIQKSVSKRLTVGLMHTEVIIYEYLALIVRNSLPWHRHVDNIRSAAACKLGPLRHKLRNFASNVKLLSYFSMVLPELQ